MPVSDIPLFSMLRTRMQWHQERQKVLAENVANADTPNFRTRDLKPLDFGRGVRTAGQVAGQVRIASTNPAHITGSAGNSAFATGGNAQLGRKPARKAVSLDKQNR